jgi:hypothetical protein
MWLIKKKKSIWERDVFEMLGFTGAGAGAGAGLFSFTGCIGIALRGTAIGLGWPVFTTVGGVLGLGAFGLYLFGRSKRR